MAGFGSRFQQAGYKLPKPLIPVHGRPMIEVVIENLRPRQEHRYIFICLESHVGEHGLNNVLPKWAPNCEIVTVNQVTQGAACTVLLARDFINNNDALMIANSDQWVDIDINLYLAGPDSREVDGLIMTMTADDPKWSYVKLDENKYVLEVREKEVISAEATVGIYNFTHGSDFVRSAETMIRRNLRVNNEFYVAPVYNQLIEEGARIAISNIGEVGGGMYGLGTPADLTTFLADPVSMKISGRT